MLELNPHIYTHMNIRVEEDAFPIFMTFMEIKYIKISLQYKSRFLCENRFGYVSLCLIMIHEIA